MFIPKHEGRYQKCSLICASTEIIPCMDYRMGGTNHLLRFIRELLSKGELGDVKQREGRNTDK